MTERPTARRSAGGTAFGATAIFATVAALLAWQMRTGHDPLLGRGAHAAAPRTLLVREVRRRVIVTTVIQTGAASGPTVVASATPSSSTSSTASPAAPAAPLTTGPSGR